MKTKVAIKSGNPFLIDRKFGLRCIRCGFIIIVVVIMWRTLISIR